MYILGAELLKVLTTETCDVEGARGGCTVGTNVTVELLPVNVGMPACIRLLERDDRGAAEAGITGIEEHDCVPSVETAVGASAAWGCT